MRTRKINIIFLLLIIILNIIYSQEVHSQKVGKIIVKVKGLKNDKGYVRSHLYNDPATFPLEAPKSMKRIVVKPKNKEATLVFENIPYGTYALDIHHDENANEEMDRSVLGYPKEGFGLSNNPKLSIKIPQFDQCKFTLYDSVKVITIYVKYLPKV
ncbi:MAG TPA: DUF2141 domain-containing protein [Candidatus Kapabacteria bacterium]|jgi:uncharacterized protein (DUF2141 family)|nr:DUF2141 domain-containing protein [Candidatus Kapabacteria bacterium]HOV91939.1 DUF2141 domain-containing protein [Candidatus Kapabacteria bacterium]